MLRPASDWRASSASSATCKLRLPFRFGVITVTRCDAGGDPRRRSLSRTAARASASPPRRWPPNGSTRTRAFSDAQNLDQLRQSLAIAIELYRARGSEHAVRPLRRHLSRPACARRRRSGWCRWWRPTARRCSTAPSSMRSAAPSGRSFADDDRAECCGHRRRRSDARPCRISTCDAFLRGLRPRPTSPCGTPSAWSIRSSPPTRSPDERVNDGLPETLEEVVRHYRRALLQAQGRRQRRRPTSTG